MAWCEKVCEYSGDYDPIKIWKDKRDHIQILSQYRKHFRNKKAVLLVEIDEVYGKRALVNIDGRYNGLEDINQEYEIAFSTMGEYLSYMVQVEKEKFKLRYAYILEVEIDGRQRQFLNFSSRIGSVKRRLKRLVGARNLKIKSGHFIPIKDRYKNDFEKAIKFIKRGRNKC